MIPGEAAMCPVSLYIIFLTAVMIDWEDLGVADIIQKPFDSRTLVRKVKEVFG